jgi:DNA-directed RNA polymerase
MENQVTLKDRQREREADSQTEGITRYFKETGEEDFGDTKTGKHILFKRREGDPNVVEILCGHLTDVRERVESGKAGAGKPALAMSYLKELEMEPVAYLTVRIAIVSALRSDKFTATCMRIANAIEDQVRFEELRGVEPALAKSMEMKARRFTASRHRTNMMRNVSDTKNVRGLSWKPGDKVRLGGFLLDKLTDVWKLNNEGVISDAIEKYPDPEGKNRTVFRLRGGPGLLELIERGDAHHSLLRPKYMPMVVPPRDWEGLSNGGYLTVQCATSFIREKLKPESRDDWMSWDMSRVYEAVNNTQLTPWRINKDVFEVFKTAWEGQDLLGGLPERDPTPLPARPVDIPLDLRTADMTEDQNARFMSWKIRAAKTHEYNAQLSGKRLSVITKKLMAAELAEEERFYFPHNLDFRGRLYSIVPELNQQADDLGKSLLMFADGKPLGDTGGYWLAVHIANLFGEDKCSFDERVAWVQENEQFILDSADNPLDGFRFWCTAGDPWQFLAACFEWAGFQREGAEFVSHLPIAMDGSCSGLQHFSAMLLDEDGARSVNLVNADTPSDIYTEVAEVVEAELRSEKYSGDMLALAWTGKVTRKIVKRPCMTFAYSVTARGMRDQILDELRKEGEGYLRGFENWEAANMIAPLVDQAIRSTVKRAAEAMGWLKSVVKVLLKADRPVMWSTPMGFPVQQMYMQSTSKKYFVWYQGRRIRVSLREHLDSVDARKQASAIAPNFVHSMDASHLQAVVNRMVNEKVTDSFSVIHDSFGVHACDVDELNFVIRDEFINLYSTSQLEKFRNWVISALPASERGEVPEVPTPGSFNLEEVRDADFFFA